MAVFVLKRDAKLQPTIRETRCIYIRQTVVLCCYDAFVAYRPIMLNEYGQTVILHLTKFLYWKRAPITYV